MGECCFAGSVGCGDQSVGDGVQAVEAVDCGGRSCGLRVLGGGCQAGIELV